AEAYRVLVVEDHPDNRYLLRSLLEPFGFQVRDASNGEEGLEAVLAWDPHLVLMDRRMPVMDGLAATRAIRALTLPRQPTIVAITAHAFKEEREEALVMGCDDFLAKPFVESEFFAMLEKHLSVGIRWEIDAERPSAPERNDEWSGLANLPDSLRRKLSDGLASADIEAIRETLDGIRPIDADLALLVADHVERFDYERVAKWLRTFDPGDGAAASNSAMETP
ncbi:MAG: response regulator, partial [Fibrobacterota bacterium]